MFIISINYIKPLEEIERYLNAHIAYLNTQYQKGHFIASGRKEPRTGGIIFSKITDKNKLVKILDNDPFKINKLANYNIIEFIPTKTCDELKFLME